MRRAGLRALTVNLTCSCAAALVLFSRALYYTPAVPLRMESGVVTMETRLYQQHLLLAGSFVLTFLLTLCTFMLTLMILHRREKRFAEETPC